MATWRSDIKRALRNLGNTASLGDIYAEVRRIRPLPHPPALEAIIRGELERHSSDSENWQPGAEDAFYSVQGVGRGVWGLR